VGDALKYLWYSFYTSLAGMYWKPLVLSVSRSEGNQFDTKMKVCLELAQMRIGPDVPQMWPRFDTDYFYSCYYMTNLV